MTHKKSKKSRYFDGSRFINIGSTRKLDEKINPDKIQYMVHYLRNFNKRDWPSWIEYTPSKIDKKNQYRFSTTFINHATVVFAVGAVVVLTDPMFSFRASPVQFFGPRRMHNVGVNQEDVPPVDMILVSHNHYDHMDMASLKYFENRDNPLLLCGLGNDKTLKTSYFDQVIEMDWFESYRWPIKGKNKSDQEAVVTFVPARHYSGRGILDFNKTLWGGFMVEIDGMTIYFAGDTGTGPHMELIAEKFPAIDIGFLPIGAYEPRSLMKESHINPEEAVLIHQSLNIKKSIGVHWGTFRLTFEPRLAPIVDLEAAKKKHNIPEDDFIVLQPGETYSC